MRHMETWFGETELKWDSGFLLEHTPKKSCLTRLRKKYVVKIVRSHDNTLHNQVMAEAVHTTWRIDLMFKTFHVDNKLFMTMCFDFPIYRYVDSLVYFL
ncbi:hypothetical protein Hanom_Chr01g00084041 [Helianthus anomalus]